MEHDASTTTTEAERLLCIAAKLLHSNDLTGAREFSLLAQETDPLLDGSDQILSVAEVLLAARKPRDGNPDHYSVLGLDAQTAPDLDAVRRQYRRLALLLHPDKSKTPMSEAAFRHVSEAWAVLSDPEKKAAYDSNRENENSVPMSETAFRHVAEAWAVLSDPAKKAAYDRCWWEKEERIVQLIPV